MWDIDLLSLKFRISRILNFPPFNTYIKYWPSHGKEHCTLLSATQLCFCSCYWSIAGSMSDFKCRSYFLSMLEVSRRYICNVPGGPKRPIRRYLMNLTDRRCSLGLPGGQTLPESLAGLLEPLWFGQTGNTLKIILRHTLCTFTQLCGSSNMDHNNIYS